MYGIAVPISTTNLPKFKSRKNSFKAAKFFEMSDGGWMSNFWGSKKSSLLPNETRAQVWQQKTDF